MGAQVGQPSRVRDVCFAARDVPGFPGIDQHDVQPLVFEQVVEGPPVVAGCFHHDQGYVLIEEVFLQVQDPAGHRGPGRHGGRGGLGLPALDADADLRVLLRHIDARAARVNDLYGGSPSEIVSADKVSVFRGGRINNKSDIRAQRQHSTVPRTRSCALRHQTDSQAHRHHRTIGVDRNTLPSLLPDRGTAPDGSPPQVSGTHIFHPHGGAKPLGN